ncbi:MAG: bifunctional metallophosphatase/5'-nucleotidase [Candidatus Aminicenantales bacterium]
MSIIRRPKFSGLIHGVCAALAAAVCLGFFSAVPAAGQTPPDLIILFTNDLHSAVRPFRLLAADGQIENVGGFARIATMIKAEREKFGDRVLAVDAGDVIAGTLFPVILQSEAAEFRLLALAGFEVMTIGNHEFDYGPAVLARALTTAKVKHVNLPIVASNIVFDPKDDRDNLLEAVFRDYPVREYLILQKNGLKIGLFGLMGKQAADDSPDAAPVTFSNPISRAREITAIMRDKEKVDCVIALSHSGVTDNPKSSEDDNLAKEVPGIDVIISGHPHRRIPSPIVVGSTIVGGVGTRGEELGDLRLRRGPDGRFQVESYDLRRVTPDLPEDPAVAAEVAALNALVDEAVVKAGGINPDGVVAETKFPLSDQAPGPGNTSWETGLGDLIVNAERRAVLAAEAGRPREPIVALFPFGHIRFALLPGPITGNDVFQVLSLGIGPDDKLGFPLINIWLTGREIRRLFEVESTIAPSNTDAHLIVAGASVRYNPHRAPFDRVTRIEIEEPDGTMKPVEPDRLYRVVANIYMGRMIGYVSKASHGLLKLVPKDAEGKPRTDLENLIVDADPATSGVQEIKEWSALAAFLKAFPDTDNTGIADIPLSYGVSAGRVVAEPSWNPVKLLAGAHALTFILLGLIILVPLLLFLFLRRIFRRLFRRKKAPAKV